MTDNASEIDVTARSTIGKTTASNQISSRAKKLGQLVEKGLSGLGENQIKGFLNNALLEIEGSLSDFEKDYDGELLRLERLLSSRKGKVTKALSAGLVKVQYGKGQDYYAVDYAQMYNAFFEKVLKIVKATKSQGSSAILGQIQEHIHEMIGNDSLTDDDKALMNKLIQEMQALQKERAKIKVVEVGKPPEQKVTVEVKQEVKPVTQEEVVAAVKEKQAAGVPAVESQSPHAETIKKLEADVDRLQKEMLAAKDAAKEALAKPYTDEIKQAEAAQYQEEYEKKHLLWEQAVNALEKERKAQKDAGITNSDKKTLEEQLNEFRETQKTSTDTETSKPPAKRRSPSQPRQSKPTGAMSDSDADYVSRNREKIQMLDDAFDEFLSMQATWTNGIQQSIEDMLDGVRLASQEMVFVITAEIQKNIGGKLKTIGKQIEESIGAKSTSGVASIAGKLDTINTTLLEIKNGLVRQKYIQDIKSVPKSAEDEAPQKAIAEIIGDALNHELAPLLGEVLGETSEYNWQKWLTLEGDVRKPFIDKFIGLNKGGIVPGTGTSDRVPALLTPGEWVINPRRLAGGTFDFAYEADSVLKSASIARKYKNEYAYLSSLPSDRSIALAKDLLMQPMDKVIAYDTASNIAGAIGSFNRPTLTDSVLPIRGADRGSGWNMYVGELAALERGKGLGPTLIGMALAKALKGPVGDLLTHIELKAIPFKDTVASYLKMGFIPVGEQNPLEPLIPMAANIKDFLSSPKVSPDVRLALPKKGIMSREHPALKDFSLTAFPYEVIDPVTAAGTIVPAGTRTPSIFRYLAGGTITDIAAYIRHAIFGAPGFKTLSRLDQFGVEELRRGYLQTNDNKALSAALRHGKDYIGYESDYPAKVDFIHAARNWASILNEVGKPEDYLSAGIQLGGVKVWRAGQIYKGRDPGMQSWTLDERIAETYGKFYSHVKGLKLMSANLTDLPAFDIGHLDQSEIVVPMGAYLPQSLSYRCLATGTTRKGAVKPGEYGVVGEHEPEAFWMSSRGLEIMPFSKMGLSPARFLSRGTLKEQDVEGGTISPLPKYVADPAKGVAHLTAQILSDEIQSEVGPAFLQTAGGFKAAVKETIDLIAEGKPAFEPKKEPRFDPVKQMKLDTGKLGMQFERLVSSTRYAVTGGLIFAHVLRILTATSQVYQKSMGAVGRGWGYMLDMIIRPLLPAFLSITRGFIWLGNFFKGHKLIALGTGLALVGVAVFAALYSIYKMKKDVEAAAAAFEKLTAALNGTPYTPPEQGPGILSRIWGRSKRASMAIFGPFGDSPSGLEGVRVNRPAGEEEEDGAIPQPSGQRIIKYKAALGMRIPGYGGGDSVPVLTEPGELIVPKEVVRRFEHRAEGGVAGAGGDFGSWMGGIIGGAGDIFKGGITTIAQGVGSFLSSDIGKSIVGGLGVASKMIGAVMAPIAGVGIAIGAIKGGMRGLGRIFVKGQQAQVETAIAVGKAQRNLLSMISLEGMGLLAIAGLSLAVLNSILHALPVATLPGPAGKGVGDIFKDLFGNLWEFIKEKARGLFDWLKEKAAGIWEFIKEKAAGIWEFIKEKALGIWEAIKERALGIWEAIKERLGGIWESIKERALGIWEFIKEKAGGIWESIKEKASGVWDFAKTKLGEVIEFLKGLLPKGVDVAKNLGQKVVDTVLGKEVFDEITGESMGRKGGVAGVLKDVAAVGDKFLGKGGTAALAGASGLGLFTGAADYIRTGDVGSAATTGAMTTAGAFAFAKLLTRFPKLGPVGGVAGYFARDTMIKDGATIGKAIAGPLGEDMGGIAASLVNDITAGAVTGSSIGGPVGAAGGAILGPIILGFKDLFAMKEEADKLASGLNLTPEQANAGGHLTNQYGFLGSVAATAYNTGVDLQGAPAVVGAAVTGGIDTATRAISDALTKAGDVLSAVVATVTGVVDAVIATVTAWQESAAAAGDTVREAILGAFASLGEYLAGLPSAIMEIIDRYLSGLPGIGGLFNSAKGALNIPSMASGGDILSDGVVNVHSGEAIIPARVNTNSNVRTDTTKTTITNHNTFVVQREDDRILFEKFKQMMVADSRRLVI